MCVGCDFSFISFETVFFMYILFENFELLMNLVPADFLIYNVRYLERPYYIFFYCGESAHFRTNLSAFMIIKFTVLNKI